MIEFKKNDLWVVSSAQDGNQRLTISARRGKHVAVPVFWADLSYHAEHVGGIMHTVGIAVPEIEDLLLLARDDNNGVEFSFGGNPRDFSLARTIPGITSKFFKRGVAYDQEIEYHVERLIIVVSLVHDISSGEGIRFQLFTNPGAKFLTIPSDLRPYVGTLSEGRLLPPERDIAKAVDFKVV